MNITVNSPLNVLCHLLSGFFLEQVDSLSVMNLRRGKETGQKWKKELINEWWMAQNLNLGCVFLSLFYVQGFQANEFFFNFYSHAYVRIIYERIKR